MGRILFSRAVGAVVLALLAAVPVPASADVGDLLAAELSNTLDQLDASDTPSDPNVTCDVKAGGRDVVQHTNFVVGEIYAQDFGLGQGECVSLDGSRRYWVTLRVQLEYFTRTSLTSGYWTPIPGCDATNSISSINGVAAPVPPVTFCLYGAMSPYLNRYHRAHAILTPWIPGAAVRHAYSPTWYMAP